VEPSPLVRGGAARAASPSPSSVRRRRRRAAVVSASLRRRLRFVVAVVAVVAVVVVRVRTYTRFPPSWVPAGGGFLRRRGWIRLGQSSCQNAPQELAGRSHHRFRRPPPQDGLIAEWALAWESTHVLAKLVAPVDIGHFAHTVFEEYWHLAPHSGKGGCSATARWVRSLARPQDVADVLARQSLLRGAGAARASQMLRLVRHRGGGGGLEARAVADDGSPEVEAYRAFSEGFSVVLTGVERLFEPAFKLCSRNTRCPWSWACPSTPTPT
ncbi:unnamed protein product, partial [Prorocentrum cordatum]